MVDTKGPGRGRGRFTAAGAQADLAARVAAIEAFLELDTSDETEVPEVPEAPSDQPA